jgi:hypothetical protein
LDSGLGFTLPQPEYKKTEKVNVQMKMKEGSFLIGIDSFIRLKVLFTLKQRKLI